MQIRTCLILLMCFIVVSAYQSLPAANRAFQAEQENVIRRIVFNHLFKQASTDINDSIDVYCLVLERGKEPNRAFIDDFSIESVKVTTKSDCIVDSSENSNFKDLVIDKNTGKRGVIFFITEIRWAGNSKVHVKAGYDSGVMSGATFLYDVEKKPGTWTIKKSKRLKVA